MDCFDADVLIFAAIPNHPGGRRVRQLIERGTSGDLVGSVLLLPEVLSKPTREDNLDELERVGSLLTRLSLREVDRSIAGLATSLGAAHRLRAPDAVHLATAVSLGADRFITNNRRDFDRSIAEVDVVFPEDLPEPA